MSKLLFSSVAIKDVQEIVNYYDEINPKISDAFLDELDEAKYFIEQHPQACVKKLNLIRVRYLKRFKYGVYFKIYHKSIAVIGVLHNSRNPQIWKNR